MAYDLQIGTGTVFSETSGEPPEGQRGVSHVLVNRLRDGRWGKTLAAVCLAPDQFSSWNTTDPNRKRLAETPDNNPILFQIQGYLQAAMDGTDPDPTGGALYYFNPAEVMPSWAADFIKTVSIGHHDFYKEP